MIMGGIIHGKRVPFWSLEKFERKSRILIRTKDRLWSSSVDEMELFMHTYPMLEKRHR